VVAAAIVNGLVDLAGKPMAKIVIGLKQLGNASLQRYQPASRLDDWRDLLKRGSDVVDLGGRSPSCRHRLVSGD